ncbi:MAG: hypothetical protein M3256_24300 [Actinomycetota bacterium]|nr:hypothetical protein [Actinomycetota bacterium]
MNQILANADERRIAYTAKASDVIRNLAFVSVALVWLFAGGKSSSAVPADVLRNIEKSPWLFRALLLTVAFFILDIVQYVWASFAWTLFRWTLQHVLESDETAGHKGGISWRSRVGWRFASLLHIKKSLDVRFNIRDATTTKEKWSTRRDLTRTRLRAYQRSDPVGGRQDLGDVSEYIESTSAPNAINLVVSCCFAVKTIVMFGAYTSVLAFLLT